MYNLKKEGKNRIAKIRFLFFILKQGETQRK